MSEDKKTIDLPKEDWLDLCNKIDHEGLDYFVMDYIDPEGFSPMVNDDEKAVELFKTAKVALTELRHYLRLDDF